jgi:predicted acyltransferase
MNTPPQESPAAPASGRLLSLDAYRGFIMVCLSWNGFGLGKFSDIKLQANSDSGWWKFVHSQFEHGPWTGWGFWDLIMPAFIFMVGMAMPFSHDRRVRDGNTRWQILSHTLLRSGVLILLGIFLTSHTKPKDAWTLTNTLSQIGLCYPIAALCLGRSLLIQCGAALASLVLTWLVFVLYGGLPELGPGITPEWAMAHQAGLSQVWWKCSNAAHAFDVWLLNLLPQNSPFVANEGGYQTLNFLPSLATMIAGIICGDWVRSKETDAMAKLRGMCICGVALLLAGELIGHSGICPIIKRIWTPSFSLVCTGMCILMLAVFYYLVELRSWKRWTFPLLVAGANSIALYLMSQLLKPWVTSLWQRYLGKDVFLFAGQTCEPVVRHCTLGLTFWLAVYWMYRNRFFVRI